MLITAFTMCLCAYTVHKHVMCVCLMYEFVILVSVNLKNTWCSCPLGSPYIMSKKACVVQNYWGFFSFCCFLGGVDWLVVLTCNTFCHCSSPGDFFFINILKNKKKVNSLFREWTQLSCVHCLSICWTVFQTIYRTTFFFYWRLQYTS